MARFAIKARRGGVGRAILVCSAALLASACAGPNVQVQVPPTPTPNAAAKVVVQNHQHGGSSTSGMDARLFTKFGGDVAVDFSTEPKQPAVNQPFNIEYVLSSKDGSPVTPDKLLMTHGKLMHLIVVSSDLTQFAHIHPEPVQGGQYAATGTVPTGGPYLLFNEFETQSRTMQVERDEVTAGTAGASETSGATPTPAPVPLSPNLGQAQEIDGLSVVLSSTVTPRRRAPIPLTITVHKDGKPVTDLEPYLQAASHVIIISQDTRQFTHTHGDVPGTAGATGGMAGMSGTMDMSKMPPPPDHFGPVLGFSNTFMQAGMYRVWVQFGYHGKVETLVWNVPVEK